ncbi:MAG: hypothetical protein F6K42_25230 [Leptolyngbya sp. SIO1D8]|nr:hypothetical protein [Leptolyngbya sp. SIO1D8]
MKRLICCSINLGLMLWIASAVSARAVPGDSVTNVEAWIQAHPTLRPAPNETLVVNRADTPARRFTFRAMIFPVSGMAAGNGELEGIIRTEQITLVDTVDGVTAAQLEESLRAIYDAAIYNDYRRARILHRYPTDEGLEFVDADVMRQGELREGDRFGYWVDLTGEPGGFAYNGTVTVFLKEDLPALQTQLESR